MNSDLITVFFAALAVIGALVSGVQLAQKVIRLMRESLDALPPEEEKPKHRYDTESIHHKLKNEELVLEEEKPKRGRMLIGDDGELLEIVEEEFEE